jgi:hypothetical protein
LSNRDRGKRAEREVAKRVGGKRIGVLCGEDIEHAVFSFEVKSRQTFVASSWMLQAVRNCPAGKCPAVVVHVHGKRHDDDMVILKMRDFEAWMGETKTKEGTNV